jgi:hypothetical protein
MFHKNYRAQEAQKQITEILDKRRKGRTVAGRADFKTKRRVARCAWMRAREHSLTHVSRQQITRTRPGGRGSGGRGRRRRAGGGAGGGGLSGVHGDRALSAGAGALPRHGQGRATARATATSWSGRGAALHGCGPGVSMRTCRRRRFLSGCWIGSAPEAAQLSCPPVAG